MLRNREIKIYLFIVSLISVAAMSIAAIFSVVAFWSVFITSIILIIASLLFTYWRYREIEKLSSYLRKIAAGDFYLDLRENHEGELSILKSEIYKVTKMLSEHRDKLNQDKEALTEAISDISHQLKTPLTSMMMMADFLNLENLAPDKRKDFVNKIQTQLERIEWLVSSLLKLSKIDAGTAQFKKERIHVDKLIHKSIQPILIPMEVKDITLHISGDSNVSFIGDMNWSSEAILNIVKNCVEHTEQGGTISISFFDNPMYTEIQIEDNGKGIEKEDLPYVFKRFYKGKNSSDDSVGIGLAMAHSIIKKQNGDIDVKSKVGKGTKFIIKFYKTIT